LKLPSLAGHFSSRQKNLTPIKQIGFHPFLCNSSDMKFPPSHRLAAFSLVEILVVLAIIVLLIGLTIPALRSTTEGAEITRTASALRGQLALARSHALAQNTYTRVGLGQGTRDGQPFIALATLSAADGTGDGDVSDRELWPTLGRVETFPGIELDASILPSEPRPTAGNFPSWTQRVGSTDVTLDQIIEFTPRGEARIEETGGATSFVIGLASYRDRSRNNLVALRISGLTGSITILRSEDLP
jgi:type II secretory pathway pseudopilin PulG